MLTITERAVQVLENARSESEIPDDAALRVSVAAQSDGDNPGLSLGFVDEPFGGDQVGEAHGMSVCVSSEIATQLDDVTLDVVERDGAAELVLRQDEQPG